MAKGPQNPFVLGKHLDEGEHMTWSSGASEAELEKMGDPATLELVFEEELESIQRWLERRIQTETDVRPRLLFYIGGLRQFHIGMRHHNDSASHMLALTECLTLCRAAGITEVISFAVAQMVAASDEEIASGHLPRPDGTSPELLSLYVAAFGPKGRRFVLAPMHLHGRQLHWEHDRTHDTAKEPGSAATLEPYTSVVECVADPLPRDEELTRFAVRWLRSLGHEITEFTDEQE